MNKYMRIIYIFKITFEKPEIVKNIKEKNHVITFTLNILVYVVSK